MMAQRLTTTLTVKNDHGFCPNCNKDFDGGYIWDTFYHRLMEDGYWQRDDTKPLDHEAAKLEADKISDCYGADRYQGKWGHAIGISWNDRVQEYMCPDCEHKWPRSFS